MKIITQAIMYPTKSGLRVSDWGPRPGPDPDPGENQEQEVEQVTHPEALDPETGIRKPRCRHIM